MTIRFDTVVFVIYQIIPKSIAEISLEKLKKVNYNNQTRQGHLISYVMARHEHYNKIVVASKSTE